jgi:hypothetical protein
LHGTALSLYSCFLYRWRWHRPRNSRLLQQLEQTKPLSTIRSTTNIMAEKTIQARTTKFPTPRADLFSEASLKRKKGPNRSWGPSCHLAVSCGEQ